jgi:mediator of RNA polymerase II transcription subunit 14
MAFQSVKLEDSVPKPLFPSDTQTNGTDGDGSSFEQFEHELPTVHDGQVPLGELLSRVVQAIYAELSELAETYATYSNVHTAYTHATHRMPSSSDNDRKRTLAEFVVRNKKQVAKLYALAKWARDADTVQKCMVRNQ